MALDTYSGLQTAIASQINRTDLTSVIPDFITMAEAMFNRELRVPEMEEGLSESITTESLALPADFLQARSLYIDRDPKVELDFVPYGTFRTQYASSAAGLPEVYTVADGSFLFGPTPGDTYTLKGVYYEKIPALSVSNTSNWLLASHPDLYLYGSLIHANDYIRDDSQRSACAVIAGRIIEEVNAAGRKRQAGASPLVARPRRMLWGPTAAKGVW